MIFSVIICLASFAWLVVLLRRNKISLGLPIAYLFTVLFSHMPGAIAHIAGGSGMTPTAPTVIGIRLTAIACACFVAGVALARLARNRDLRHLLRSQVAPRFQFAMFCLISGLGVTYGMHQIQFLTSIGAIVRGAGSIWILGVVIGLPLTLRLGLAKRVVFWLGAMCIFPVLTLLLGGFLSFGSASVFIILSAVAVSMRSNWKVAIAIPLVTVIFVSLFISYFLNRDEIRESVWGGADMGLRVEKSWKVVTDFALIDLANEQHLQALDRRLNQNYFVGMAANRIESGQVSSLKGLSVWEGLISLVPRVIWPSKPVFGGSPEIVSKMTGFKVNSLTTYGVGNVMEFYINFGVPSLVIGFLLLGYLIGWLDRKAALAVQSGNLGSAIVFFLPAASMIEPLGSIVELTGRATCCYIAAIGWRWGWRQWSDRFTWGNRQNRPQAGITGR